MATEFRWLSLVDARSLGLDDLVALHWEEIEDYRDVSPLDVDWGAYRDLERRGTLRIAGLLKDGRLVGYSTFHVQPTLHNRSTLWAVNDAIYLDPDHRQGWAGVRLVRQAERDLKAMGVKVILYSVKEDTGDLAGKRQRDTASKLLQRLGYSSFDRSWTKAL